jgi:hypothetical protein
MNTKKIHNQLNASNFETMKNAHKKEKTAFTTCVMVHDGAHDAYNKIKERDPHVTHATTTDKKPSTLLKMTKQ